MRVPDDPGPGVSEQGASEEVGITSQISQGIK
jgi:hypothetical protein